MSKQRKRIWLVVAVIFVIAVGTVFYATVLQGTDRTPGGVFVCL